MWVKYDELFVLAPKVLPPRLLCTTVACVLYLCSHLLEFCSLQSAHPNPTFLETPQSRNVSCLLTPASFSLSPGTVSQNSELPNYLVCVQSFEGLASLSPSVAHTQPMPSPLCLCTLPQG